MLDPGKQERAEEFLRKSLLGEELINTQFHLFSARSSPPGRVIKPRVLCANNVLLAKSSKYFLDLLSADAFNPSLSDLTDDNDVPGVAQIEAYGYGSDSDLDECNDPVPIADIRPSKGRSKRSSKVSMTRLKSDDESSDGSESDDSDMFVMSPEQPRIADPLPTNKDVAGSVASSETAVQENGCDKMLANQTSMRLRSLGSRHILVKDTAFQTLYTLLNYLYTDKFSFLPLSSTMSGAQPHQASTNSLDQPRCSAKSMYRLACKVGLEYLRDEAFSYIRNNLTEHNILKELSCSLVSKHPQLLEMELDVLYSHIGSAPVMAKFASLAQRIAHKEIPHGAEIVVGIHKRFINEREVQSLRPSPAIPFPISLGPSKAPEKEPKPQILEPPPLLVRENTRIEPQASPSLSGFGSGPHLKVGGEPKSGPGVFAPFFARLGQMPPKEPSSVKSFFDSPGFTKTA